MVLAYARVSTDKQDNINQEQEIKSYCKAYKIKLDEYISVEMSSRKSLEKRRINELYDRLDNGDTLIVAELSRLGRDMLETISLIFDLIKKGVKVIFIRQPELNLMRESATKLLLSFYAYMAEHERELISQRTKAGLKVALQRGKTLGRPKGAKSESIFEPYKERTREMREMGIPFKSIWKFLGARGTYAGFYLFCQREGIE
ncbi:recombinase family protein [Campylobacter sp. MIT 19-121]|uniref:recombinase family protein n=1 Tax=Campylobacter sp. MIT 19-121 TaxID=2703906 RepID=UPI00138A5465|nr:recombinase family protein [Campylobacter sp. MIT 19-121]NDJ28041.1 recombinase family protein [Campylobacter sp. MIT 19-121]